MSTQAEAIEVKAMTPAPADVSGVNKVVPTDHHLRQVSFFVGKMEELEATIESKTKDSKNLKGALIESVRSVKAPEPRLQPHLYVYLHDALYYTANQKFSGKLDKPAKTAKKLVDMKLKALELGFIEAANPDFWGKDRTAKMWERIRGEVENLEVVKSIDAVEETCRKGFETIAEVGEKNTAAVKTNTDVLKVNGKLAEKTNEWLGQLAARMTELVAMTKVELRGEGKDHAKKA